jgi:predicted ArsR family transcriptional regulator
MTVHRGPRGLHRLLTTLGEPTRRRTYDLLRRADRPLTRADVAAELGIGVRLAAFHLDKLLAEGLASAHYARPPGRAGGPGAGRPAKQYVANPARFDVTLPPRRYDIAARILLEALQDTDQERLLAAARRYGASTARQHRELPLAELLAELGYEPRVEPGGAISLANCPFHELAEEAREETCRMNHVFLQGITSNTHRSHTAVLDPCPGQCCVRLPPAGDAPAGRSEQPST